MEDQRDYAEEAINRQMMIDERDPDDFTYLCVVHMNDLLADEDIAPQIDFGAIRVIRDHNDQCITSLAVRNGIRYA